MNLFSLSRLFCLIGIGALSIMSPASTTYAEDPRVRLQRLRKAGSTTFAHRWSHDRVMANILYRCPLSEALGFIALKKASVSPKKFSKLSQYFARIARKRDAYSDTAVRGKQFPTQLNTELSRLRSRMFKAVEELYSETTRQALADHLNRVYRLYGINVTGGVTFQ